MTDRSSLALQLDDIDETMRQQAIAALQMDFSFYRPTDKQLEFHAAGLKARERLFLGGNRTGKTFAVCVELAMHLTGRYMDDWNGYRYKRPISAIASSINLKDTRDILQKNLFVGHPAKGIPPAIESSLIVEKSNANIAGAYDTVLIRHKSGGLSELKFKAFEQGASSFQGVQADFIHLDELPSYEVYLEALTRTAAFDHEKTFITLTMWPEKGYTDMLAHFMDNAPAGEIRKERFYIVASWADNKYLPKEEADRLRESYPAWQIEAREHGVPVFGHGKVFTMPEEEIFMEPFEVPAPWHQVYGLDLSSSSNGTWGAVLLAIDRDNDIVYAMRDYERSDLTPMEHAYNIKQMVPEWCVGMNDPAGAGENMHTKEKTLDFLKDTCGLTLINAYKANGTKEATIADIYMRYRSDKFKIMYAPAKKNEDGTTTPERGCRHLVREWRQYARDDKGNILKKNDHTIDALLYALGGLYHAVNQSSYDDDFSSDPDFSYMFGE